MMQYGEKDRALFRAVVDKWGELAQWLMLLEEMAELGARVAQHLRGRDVGPKLDEELADVAIMLGQALEMRSRGGNHALRSPDYMFKMNRLAERLGESAQAAWVGELPPGMSDLERR